ncbi:MAG TPA: hypothetical protein VK960_02845 [Acidimicrobiia bacterium]|nr:hypothetical protein [Acidimicrobiia bacterium]
MTERSPNPTEERLDVDVDQFDEAPTRAAAGEHAGGTTRTVRWRAWSPAQLVAGALGLFLTVLGGIVLARIGFGDLTSPETSVFGFGHTPLLAMIEVAVGLLLMLDAASAFASRAMLIGLGGVAAAFGLIIVIEPGAFQDWLGVTRNSGWLYLGIGAGAFLLGGLSPVFARR